MTTPDRINHNPALTPPLAPAEKQPQKQGPKRTSDGKTFGDVLRTKVAEQVKPKETPSATPAETSQTPALRWSAHATARLRQRGINLQPAQMQRLESAVQRAAQKGSRDSLVMMDNVAMVVSVKNRTVITAVGADQAKDNVFTNIDSAVIA